MSLRANTFFRIFSLALLLSLSACGAKKVGVVKGAAVNTTLGSKAVIKSHYAAAAEFKTLSGRMKIDYKSGGSEQSIPATFRMEKDKALWLSVFFGMGKAFITPKKVSFYSALNNISFEGDFEALSSFVGTPLDFSMIQGLLLGESAVDLKSQRFKLDAATGVYRLKPQRAMAFFKLFIDLDPTSFKVVQAQISQASQDSSIQINYPAYETMDGLLLPAKISVEAQLGSATTSVGISYKNISVNRPLNFPFKIPKGLKALSLPTDAE